MCGKEDEAPFYAVVGFDQAKRETKAPLNRARAGSECDTEAK